jgi:hypothetical protein
MVMIRCPECGQRVLDVASSCPHCHRVLIQNPLETHDWTALIECGRCHKHIDRSARVCPYCGHQVRAARMAVRTTAGILGAVALVVIGIILVRTGVIADFVQNFRPASRASAPQAEAPPAVVAEPPDRSTIAAASPDSSPSATAQRGATESTRVAETLAPPVSVPAPSAPVTLGDVVTRWTADWANVRRDRSIESPAVQVLPPGREIQVGDRQRGWWVVYADQRPIGYIANSVLTAIPPTDPGEPLADGR